MGVREIESNECGQQGIEGMVETEEFVANEEIVSVELGP